MSAARDFILRSTLTSPFGRKVRIGADILGLAERITLVPADPLDGDDALRQQNPLGKMPCLLLADGTAIYDSRVIIEFLQETAGTDRLLPLRGPARYRTLTRATLADGITDAALLIVYEGRFRTPAQISERWLAHQRGKILRGLAVFEATPPEAGRLDLASIGLACTLGYLDWRRPLGWRAEHPRLAAWLDDLEKHEPAIGRTRVPAEPSPAK
ncbi:MAG: glutathione S-transferase N-terminal domain-containing protein [Hyphomicrobiales bacterium]